MCWSDKNKLFRCQICGTKVCDTCGFYYNGLKLYETCKAKEEPRLLAQYGNGIGMKFTLIPAGEFEMGLEENKYE